MNQITFKHQNLGQKKDFSWKKIFEFVKKVKKKPKNLEFFFQIPITFFGAGRRDSEEHKKMRPSTSFPFMYSKFSGLFWN